MSHSIGIADASFENDDSFEKLKAKHQNLLKDCTCAFNDIVVLQASSDFVETFIYPQLPKITAKEKIVLGELVSSMPLKNIVIADGISATYCQ